MTMTDICVQAGGVLGFKLKYLENGADGGWGGNADALAGPWFTFGATLGC